MASDSIRNSHIEVERKFVPTALLQAQLDGKFREFERLRQQQGPDKVAQPSSFLSFFRLPDKDITDRYVDYQDVLFKKGIWTRKRSTKTVQTFDFPLVNDGKESSEWEAKLRLGGDDRSSQMLGAYGSANMKSIATTYAPGVNLSDFVLTAEITTRRRTYIVQKPFGWHREANQAGEIRVVVDEVVATDGKDLLGEEDVFRHEIGEVELTAEVTGGETDEEHDVLRRRQLAGMQARLDEFVKRNASLFPTEGVKGKLEAFFEWKEERSGSGAMI